MMLTRPARPLRTLTGGAVTARRWPAVAAAALMAIAAAASGQAEAGRTQMRRPNVLVLVSDDQRADTIAALGNHHIRTPNLDRLVREGFVFERAYCMGSWSGAVCLPSRAMLLTGRTLWRIGQSGQWATDLGTLPLWPAVMREAGYATFGTGKWHNGRPSFVRGFERGEAVFFGGMSDHSDVPAVRLTSDPDGSGGPDGAGAFERIDTEGAHSSELFADAAVRFLRGYEGDRPFFMYVAFTAPHDPRTPPAEYTGMYDPADLPLPPNYMPRHPFDNGEMEIRDEQLLPLPRTEQAVRKELALYYAMISHMDAQIGRILDALEATGRARDTLIVFTSDHGLAIGSHGLLGKQNLYEHSMRAPLVFAGPGVPAGRSDRLVYLLDIFPTVCQMTAVPIPAEVEGVGLLPVISGREAPLGRNIRGQAPGHNFRGRDSLFTAYKDVQRAVRDERWKLIRYEVEGRRTVQLFDLREDPHETRNLADRPEHTAAIERLERLMRRWQNRLDDPLLGEP